MSTGATGYCPSGLARLITLFAVGCLTGAPAAAQPPQGGGTTVADALAFLVTTQAVDTGDAARDRAAAAATSRTLSKALVTALAALPLTSSSSAFTYRFSPELGTLQRDSESFGPFFVERATTSGAGRAAIGLSWQYARFTNLDGFSLRDGSLVTTSNGFVDERQPFDVETLALDIRAHSFTIAGTVGLTDRVDIGAVIPVVRLSLYGTRTDVYRGERFQQATARASVTRVADVMVRAKVNLARGRWGAVAAGGDLRLPTGPEEDLLGAGRPGARGFVVVSAGSGPVSTHLTGGITRGGVSNGLDLGGAIAANPSPLLTLTAEFFARRWSELGTTESVTAPHPTIPGVSTLRLAAAAGTSTGALGAFGLKWNVSETWLLSGTLMVPLNRAGMTANLIPSVALEYNFSGPGR